MSSEDEPFKPVEPIDVSDTQHEVRVVVAAAADDDVALCEERPSGEITTTAGAAYVGTGIYCRQHAFECCAPVNKVKPGAKNAFF